MSNSFRIVALIVLAPMAASCVSAFARTPADRPALDVPQPPPRVIEPAPPPAPPPEPVPDLPAASSAVPRPRPPARDTAPAPKDPKPESKPPEPAVTETVPPVQPASSSPPLRTPQTADSIEATKNVRTTIERAHATLNGIDYQALSATRKQAYDDAKMFIQQAEDALKGGNYVFAQSIASKAETLARELGGK